jgi:8-oxo-dGTP pyrophosphatase MutT (NUDIX family)
MRNRATAVVLRQKQILIVRDRDHHSYSLPGGNIKKGELILAAAVRELFEELGMEANKAVRMPNCDYVGKNTKHYVVFIESQDTPFINDKELDDFLWWDGRVNIPCYPHVKAICDKLTY